MIVVTPQQMSEIDKKAITDYEIPALLLMENAAIRVFDQIKKTLKNLKNKKILIISGKGNNGGDALATARHLFNNYCEIRLFLTCSKNLIKNEARKNLSILEKMGIIPLELDSKSNIEEFKKHLVSCDLVLDGIFGTGLNGNVATPIKEIIEIINNSNKYVISIDIPSGICGKTGTPQGAAIKASKTIALGFSKLGHFLHPGSEYVGELLVADIGIPQNIINDPDFKTHVIDSHLIKSMLPKRINNSNKGSYGKLFIVSGSQGMLGAPILASSAALRTGCGIVYLGMPSSLCNYCDPLNIECVKIPLNDTKKGSLSKDSLPQILEMIEKCDTLAIGPGLSQSEDIFYLVSETLKNSNIPLVLDADALNVISKDISILKTLKNTAIITPHPGEMARLLGTSINNIQENRIKYAKSFSEKFGVITVLKGYRTIIAAPNGEIYINLTGNSGMATAGTGDVLTGMISGFLAQKISFIDSSILGVFLHGQTGDNVAKIKGEHGLVASDLVNELPFTLMKV